MSFTKIAPREIKLRCYRCGRTRNVRTIGKHDLCGKCWQAIVNEGIRAIGAK